MSRLFTIIVVFVAALTFCGFSADAQKPKKAWRIGVLLSGTLKSHSHHVAWLRNGLKDFGYIDGRDFVFVLRWGMGKRKRLPELAKELVRESVDVIVVNGGASVRAAGKATRTIPIVVGSAGGLGRRYGLVKSLAKPGGNVTGSTYHNLPDLSAKRFSLLKEAVPKLNRFAFIFYPLSRARSELKKLREIAAKTGIEVLPLQVRNGSDIEAAFASMKKLQPDALMINTSALTNLHRDRLVARANEMKLPSMCEQWAFVHSGCLMSYSTDREYMMARAAYFIDKILKGANPGELPVERSHRYKLVINVNTAKALRLTLPSSILLQADEVIE
jgi:putative ABC transport system substrate-binding protein